MAAPAAANVSAVPTSSEAINFDVMAVPFFLASHTEISVKLVHIGLQFRVGKTVDDLAVLDDEIAVGDGGGEAEVLLDQEDCKALFLQPRDSLADLLDDDGREPLGRLVQHQEGRAGAQDARD